MACSVCWNLLPPHVSELKEGQRATQFIVFQDLLASASSTRCAECRLLSDAVTMFKPETAHVQDGSVIELTLVIGKPLQLYYKQVSLNLEIFRDTNPSAHDAIPPTIGPAAHVSPYSGSPECLHKIQTWISDCEAHHPSCAAQALPAPLPTRALRLSPSDPDLVSLVSTSGSSGRYLALSYCWGDPTAHPSLTTTLARLAAHASPGIRVSALPRTLRDAVALTRDLGFEWLWVDALCIVQDDAADWLREAAAMHLVYARASLTLVASRACGSAEGMFGPQGYAASRPVGYGGWRSRGYDGVGAGGEVGKGRHGEGEHEGGTTLFVRSERTREHVDFTGLQREPFGVEPINKRAWTLQEALLSPRAVVFAMDELRWWCGGGTRCECGVFEESMKGSGAMNGADDLRRIFWRGRDLETAPRLSREEAYRLWDEAVMLYAQRSLTVEGDRLPALAGLAKEFARVIGGGDDEYLAGLWNGDLPKGLLWHVARYAQRDPGIQKRRPREWRAPSWSWAAVEACVDFPMYLGMRWIAEVVDVEVVPKVTVAGELGDEFMAVETCRLVVRAPFIEGLVVEHHPEQLGAIRTLSQNGVPLCGFISDDQYLGIWGTGPSKDEVCALVIGHNRIIRRYSLLILKVDTETTYRRVGVAAQGLYLANNETPQLDLSMLEPFHSYMSTSPEPIENAPWKEVTIV